MSFFIVSIANAHIIKKAVKNKADFKRENPIINKSKLCIEWYKVNINVANNDKIRQNLNPLNNTLRIDLLIPLNLVIISFICHPPFQINIKNK